MYTLTRRGLLQAGAGAIAGAAMASTPAFAARQRRGLIPRGNGRYVGEIRLFPGTYVPESWLACDGDEYNELQYRDLADLIGATFGTHEDRHGTATPLLPDLLGRTAIGAGDGPGGPGRKLGEKERALAATGDAPAGLGLRHMISPYAGEHDQLLAEIRAFAFPFTPVDWLACTGERVEIRDHADVFSLLGDTYGGDGRTHFLTPNLSGRSPLGVGNGAGVPSIELGEKTGDLAPGTAPHARRLHLNYCIAMAGYWPSRPGRRGRPSIKARFTEPFIGEVRAFSSADVPEGWLPCHGQRLQIRDNPRLFSLLGPAFGGDAVHNFELPDLRGRAIAGIGEAGDHRYRVGDTSAHAPAPNQMNDVLPFNTITWGIAGETFVYPNRA